MVGARSGTELRDTASAQPVHRELDAPTQQCVVELAGEETLAAELVNGPFEVIIPHGADDLQLHGLPIRLERRLHSLALGQGQEGAPSSQFQNGHGILRCVVTRAAVADRMCGQARDQKLPDQK